MDLWAALAVAILLAAPAALAAQGPVQKAGEWRTAIRPAAGEKALPPRTVCVSQRSLADAMKTMKVCRTPDIRTDGNTTTLDSVCTVGKQTITTHGTIVVADENTLHAQFHSTYAPPVANMSQLDIVMDSKWLGPCRPGEKPVD